MISFRDKCFCPFYTECWHGGDCSRALTFDVKQAAADWWGSEDAPIAVFEDKPDCFKENI